MDWHSFLYKEHNGYLGHASFAFKLGNVSDHMDRPVTRSRANDSSSSAVGELSKFLQDLTKPTRARTARVDSSMDNIRAAIERRLKAMGRTVSGGPSRVVLSDEYVESVQAVMTKFLVETLRRLVLVSHHRAGLTTGPYSSMAEYSTKAEEFLSFKEDCAHFFTKAANDNFPADLVPPVFNQAEYAAHAAEEEQKLLITAQSVRRATVKDLLHLLNEIPERIASKVINDIAFMELNAEYRARSLES